MAGDVVLTGTLLAAVLAVMGGLRLIDSGPTRREASSIASSSWRPVHPLAARHDELAAAARGARSARSSSSASVRSVATPASRSATRHDHRRVLGHLRFADEADSRPPARRGPRQRGRPRRAPQEARRAPRSSSPGNGDSQRAEMQQCIRVLERFGIPFALPASGFRFGRAPPRARDARWPTGTSTTSASGTSRCSSRSSACSTWPPRRVALGAAVAADGRRGAWPSSSRRAARSSSSSSVSGGTAGRSHAEVPVDGGERRGAQGQAHGA